MITQQEVHQFASDSDRSRAYHFLLGLLDREGGDYSSVVRVERDFTRYGVPICAAFWPCPCCGVVWRDCPHPIQICYPGETQRPRSVHA